MLAGSPAMALAGPVLMTIRSAIALSIVVVPGDVLLPGVGSVVNVVTVATLTMAKLFGALEGVWTTSVKVPDAPDASEERVAVMMPVPPTGVGSVRVQPAAGVKDTKVVPAGVVSVRLRVWA